MSGATYVYEPEVTIHRFKVFDIATDEYKVSGRWVTAAGLQKVRGTSIEVAAVPQSVVAAWKDDLSPIGFTPPQPG